ncbi:MAG: hypothetical protein GY820_19700 [Gammaproteobacteria bacterium]|nr:hypothetical protein [Gammaproteobacteria bacterium]
MVVKTLEAFTEEEKNTALDILSAKVSTMLGRKMEEGDWDFVYCNAKNIPESDWSNLHIDVNHEGIGVEHKMLRVTKSGSILNECGTTKMHPAGTRSIRIPDENDPEKAMRSILGQYNELIDTRSDAVISNSTKNSADMRIGWLLWKETLDEFLYFEEEMKKPNPDNYYAEWNITPARGSRKSSRSLWVYEKDSGKKKYSVTTTAGAKIQPYFDVPAPNNENLYFFKVQGVLVDGGLVKVWLTRSTAKYLELLLGSLDSEILSEAIDSFDSSTSSDLSDSTIAERIAVPVLIKESSYEKLKTLYPPLSDEYMLQQFAIHLGENS